MFNPHVGRFMDSGDVDGRHYVHCTMKVKRFFCTAPFHGIRLVVSYVQAKWLLIMLSIETDNYNHIIKSFCSMIRGPERSRIPKDSIHGATSQ